MDRDLTIVTQDMARDMKIGDIIGKIARVKSGDNWIHRKIIQVGINKNNMFMVRFENWIHDEYIEHIRI